MFFFAISTFFCQFLRLLLFRGYPLFPGKIKKRKMALLWANPLFLGRANAAWVKHSRCATIVDYRFKNANECNEQIENQIGHRLGLLQTSIGAQTYGTEEQPKQHRSSLQITCCTPRNFTSCLDLGPLRTGRRGRVRVSAAAPPLSDFSLHLGSATFIQTTPSIAQGTFHFLSDEARGLLIAPKLHLFTFSKWLLRPRNLPLLHQSSVPDLSRQEGFVT